MSILPRTTVGKKLLMGITGIIWILFIIGHVAGNLLVFKGRSALNDYSALLHANAEVLWAVRVVIYGSLILHIASGLSLWQASAQARPVGYAMKVPQASTLASRAIRWTGLLVLGFVVFHLLHLTTGTIQPVPFQADVYANVTGGLSIGWVAAIYVVGMIAVGLHVLHGGYASLKSIGLTRLGKNPFDRRLATVLALFVFVGFTVIPLAIVSGALR